MGNPRTLRSPHALLFSVALAFTVVMVMTSASAETVFVPGNASGYFGNSVDRPVPFVSAITVNGPGTITVTYVEGTTNWGGGEVGPNGGDPCNCFNGTQYPLQEARGIGQSKVNRIGALIGVFVPQNRLSKSGFKAIDGTKDATRVGIAPDRLFFVGESLTLKVTQAGTLFLGINDNIIGDNRGGFTVDVVSTP